MTRLIAALILILATAAGTLAQTAPDEIARLAPQWDTALARAEAQVANPAIPSSVLEALRADLAALRDAARRLREGAIERVAPLRTRLDALGPPPVDGAVEAPEIAGQRTALATEIAAAEVPVKTAETALARAETLIGRIDAMVRSRFRQELLTLQASPLDPRAWQVAIPDITARLEAEARDALAGAGRAGSRLWLAAALAGAGLFLLIGVRRVVTRWFERRIALAPRSDAAGSRRRGLLDGLGLMISAALIPALGLAVLVLAARNSGIVTGAAAPLIRDMVSLAVAMLGAYWLSETLFGIDVPARTLFPMEAARARRAGRLTLALGAVLGLDLMLLRGDSAAWRSIETLSILSFVLVATGALALWRLAGTLRQDEPEIVATEEGEEPDPRAALGRAIRRLLVRAAQGVAIAAPILAALGFHAGSRFLFHATLLSGALLGLCIVIVALVDEAVETAAEGSRAGASGTARLRLIPVLTGFLLAGAAIPVLALIWGARESDLNETWALLVDGIAIGDSRISPVDFAVFAAIFAAGYFLTRLIQSLLRVTVLPQTSLDTGGQKAFASMAGYVGVLVALLAAVSAAGLDLSNLAIVAGALSVGIGFGLQTVVSNFVSGLILLIERPIKEGDWVKVGEVEGTVRRIAVRATAIQTFDRAIVTVPNADFITSTVMNRTHRSTTGRVILKVGVAYGTDTRKVAAILAEVAKTCDLLVARPEPKVVFRGFGADALEFEVYCFLRDVGTTLDATSFINHAIAERFRAEGIEIPYSQRDLHIRDLDRLIEVLKARPAEGQTP